MDVMKYKLRNGTKEDPEHKHLGQDHRKWRMNTSNTAGKNINTSKE